LTRQDSIRGQGKRRLRFFGEAVSELRKVVWPTRQEAAYLTTLVIVVTVLVAIVLGVLDFGFSKLMNIILVR
jgi:preprotein translocase subunit SecE